MFNRGQIAIEWCHSFVTPVKTRFVLQFPIREDVECEPWTYMAKCKLAVEQELRSVPGLNYIIIRPANIYGLGDKSSLSEFLFDPFLDWDRLIIVTVHTVFIDLM